MAKPISHSTRIAIIKLRQQGFSYASIAQQVGYSRDGVRKIYQRFESKGYEGLGTNYHQSGRKSPYEEVKLLVESVKDGAQGAPYIRSVLLSLHPDKEIPHERTIQRWWASGKEKKKGRILLRQIVGKSGQIRCIIPGK